MVRALGVQAEVGHVDTYNAWTNSANDEVIKACDFIGMDAYPYWQGSSIEDAYNVFFQAYQETKNHVQSVGSGAWVVRLLSFLPSFFPSFLFLVLFYFIFFSRNPISFTNTPCQVVSQQKNLLTMIFSSQQQWVTETSWPVTGANYGSAVPSVANAQKFWRSVACELFNEGHVFWYAYQDYNDSPSFGVFDSNGNAIYDLYGC